MQLIWVPKTRSSFSPRWLIFVCLALVAFTATAQVLHFHASELSGTEDRCPICQVLHSAVSLPHAIQFHFSFHAITHLPPCEERRRPLAEARFTLSSRAPPLFSLI